jgi:hypothetical protein
VIDDDLSVSEYKLKVLVCASMDFVQALISCLKMNMHGIDRSQTSWCNVSISHLSLIVELVVLDLELVAQQVTA